MTADVDNRTWSGGQNRGPAVVLASGSAARAAILRAAGVQFSVDVASIDEGEIRESLRSEGADAARAAVTLAELKASRVARRHPGALVIGGDQVLDSDGAWFDKPHDIAAARRDLNALRGKMHMQVTVVCVVRDDMLLWSHTERARLAMRDFSDAFLACYLDAAGESVLECAGAYQLEGLGAQLFTRVEGDYFSVVGLPLLPLLGFLRGHGVVSE